MVIKVDDDWWDSTFHTAFIRLAIIALITFATIILVLRAITVCNYHYRKVTNMKITPLNIEIIEKTFSKMKKNSNVKTIKSS